MKFFGEFMGIGSIELLIILGIILLLFGSKKLPQLFRSAGTSVRELRKGLEGDEGGAKKPANTENASR